MFFCSTEHILKALNSLETPEEKLAALCKKYADLHEEHRGMKLKFKQGQHKLTAVSISSIRGVFGWSKRSHCIYGVTVKGKGMEWAR